MFIISVLSFNSQLFKYKQQSEWLTSGIVYFSLDRWLSVVYYCNPLYPHPLILTKIQSALAHLSWNSTAVFCTDICMM